MIKKKIIEIALIGNPNAGKTSIFNLLAHSNNKTGNWDGVTTKVSSSFCDFENVQVCLHDLPGITSLASTSNSIDIANAHSFIYRNKIDLIINVIDASELRTQLLLTTQLKELHIPMILLINKIDCSVNPKLTINTNILKKELEIPIISVSALNGDICKRRIITSITNYLYSCEICNLEYSTKRYYQFSPIKLKPSVELKIISEKIGALIKENIDISKHYSNALLTEIYPIFFKKLPKNIQQNIVLLIQQFNDKADWSIDICINHVRYQFIDNLILSCIKKEKKNKNLTTNLKNNLCSIQSPVINFCAFIFIMTTVFYLSVSIGGIFQNQWDTLVSNHMIPFFSNLTDGYFSRNLQSIYIGCLIGISSLISFAPLLFIMHFCLNLLEQSGYITRIVFASDRIMGTFGLHGKAIIPMLLGFGCNVAAIESTSILDSRRERMIATLINPFISCSARLPVYILFATVFFKEYIVLVILSLYILGIALGLITALILARTILPGKRDPLVMKISALKIPQLSKVLKLALLKTRNFLQKTWKTVVPAIAIITALNADFKINDSLHDDSTSMLQILGRYATPLFTPMGIETENWPASVALISGFLAKEVIIATLSSVYGQSNFFAKEKKDASLGDKESAINNKNIIEFIIREAFKSNASVYAYLVFILLYAPCITVMGATRKTLGTGWMIFSFCWTTSLAYTFAVLIYQITTFF